LRITHVDSFDVLAPGAHPPFAWREGLRGGPSAGHVAVLRLRADEGVDGVALTMHRGSARVVADIVERVLRDELVGTDPLRREWLWHRMWELDRTEEFPIYLLGLVDTALWDLAGRFYGSPTWEVIGGFRRQIPAYASTSTFSSTAEYLEVATQCMELGYPAIKLHAWGDTRRDAALCTALRAHVGDS
jgi:L-alanine-DL-glutamate epimerase-like enolase superfamily enzyme